VGLCPLNEVPVVAEQEDVTAVLAVVLVVRIDDRFVPFFALNLDCLLDVSNPSVGEQAEPTETRYGLYGLFVTSGLWAGTYLVTFLTSSLALATAAYQIGLICGIATVGAWLYFCSVYTGRTYHRQRVYRVAAVATFLCVLSVKLTNQFHGLYFGIELVETPFPHASVSLFGFHWAVTLLAYSLSAVGFYMLLQLFDESPVDSTALAGLIGLLALPALVNVLAILAIPGLVAANYEPVTVAIFALGALYVTEDTFEQARWAGHQQVIDEIDEAVLLLDEAGCIYQSNAAAESLPASVAPTINTQFEAFRSAFTTDDDTDATPSEWLDDAELLRLDDSTETWYYLMRETELTIGPHKVGRAVVLSDVTTVERQRRELKRQTTQLEGFAAAVAHELRNSLAVIEGNMALLTEALETGEFQDERELITQVTDATERISGVISDLTTVVQLSQPVADTRPVAFGPSVREAAGMADIEQPTVTIGGDGHVHADKQRLVELLSNAVRLAIATNADELRACLTADGFELQMDGDSVAAGDEKLLLEYGTPIPDASAGMPGGNLTALAQANGWEATAWSPEEGGLGIRISGAVTERDAVDSVEGDAR